MPLFRIPSLKRLRSHPSPDLTHPPIHEKEKNSFDTLRSTPISIHSSPSLPNLLSHHHHQSPHSPSPTSPTSASPTTPRRSRRKPPTYYIPGEEELTELARLRSLRKREAPRRDSEISLETEVNSTVSTTPTHSRETSRESFRQGQHEVVGLSKGELEILPRTTTADGLGLAPNLNLVEPSPPRPAQHHQSTSSLPATTSASVIPITTPTSESSHESGHTLFRTPNISTTSLVTTQPALDTVPAPFQSLPNHSTTSLAPSLSLSTRPPSRPIPSIPYASIPIPPNPDSSSTQADQEAALNLATSRPTTPTFFTHQKRSPSVATLRAKALEQEREGLITPSGSVVGSRAQSRATIRAEDRDKTEGGQASRKSISAESFRNQPGNAVADSREESSTTRRKSVDTRSLSANRKSSNETSVRSSQERKKRSQSVVEIAANRPRISQETTRIVTRTSVSSSVVTPWDWDKHPELYTNGSGFEPVSATSSSKAYGNLVEGGKGKVSAIGTGKGEAISRSRSLGASASATTLGLPPSESKARPTSTVSKADSSKKDTGTKGRRMNRLRKPLPGFGRSKAEEEEAAAAAAREAEERNRVPVIPAVIGLSGSGIDLPGLDVELDKGSESTEERAYETSSRPGTMARSQSSSALLGSAGKKADYDIGKDFRSSRSTLFFQPKTTPLESNINGEVIGNEDDIAGNRKKSRFSILERSRKSMLFAPPPDSLPPADSLARSRSLYGLPVSQDAAGKMGKGRVAIKSRKGREVVGLNVMIVGGQGVGKTSFADTLMRLHAHPEFDKHIKDFGIQEEGLCANASHADKTDLAHSETRAPTERSILLAVQPHQQGETSLASPATSTFSYHPPGRQSVLTHRSLHHRHEKKKEYLFPFTIIDTPSLPGLGLAFSVPAEAVSNSASGVDMVAMKRERVMKTLEGVIEWRLGERLRGRERVDRGMGGRAGGGEDGLIHAVIYLIDPLTILTPPSTTQSTPRIPSTSTFKGNGNGNGNGKVATAGRKDTTIGLLSALADGPNGATGPRRKTVVDPMDDPTLSDEDDDVEDDTTAVGHSKTSETQIDAWNPSLSPTDISSLIRLSKRTTILPVISRADTLTKRQREVVRGAVWEGLIRAGLLGGNEGSGRRKLDVWAGLGREGEGEEGDEDEDGEGEEGLSNDDVSTLDGPGPSTKATATSRLKGILPLFCFNPEGEASLVSGAGSAIEGKAEDAHTAAAQGFKREYLWGDLDVLDERYSDLSKLYRGLMSKELATALIDKTVEEYYEDYRVERLTAARSSL